MIRGLYAITPDEPDTKRLSAMVEACLAGGANLLQYRNKNADARLRAQQAQELLPICRRYQVPFIINDDVKLCLALDADGVHIGASDGELAKVRARIGSKIIGASCYNKLTLAQAAEAAGASYVAFGACFPSGTKPGAVQAELDLFTQAAKSIRIPTIAIGGITLQNARSAIDAGANGIAVIGALFGSNDVLHTAQQFSLLFQKNHHDLSQSATI